MRPELTAYWAKRFMKIWMRSCAGPSLLRKYQMRYSRWGRSKPQGLTVFWHIFSKGIGRWLKMMWLQKYKDFFGMDIYPLRSMTLLLCLFLKGQNLQNSKTLGRLVCATWYTRWSRSAWSIGSDQFWIPFASTLMALLVPEKQNFRFCMPGCPCCTCSC